MYIDKFQYLNHSILSKLPKESGVYMIMCKANGKCYIGSSYNIMKRVREHFDNLFLNEHSIIELNNDFKEYGIENFEAIQLASCSGELKNYIEGYYIKKYDSRNTGYNANEAGISFEIKSMADELVYEKPQEIKGEIEVLKNRSKEFLNDNFDNAQVIGINNLINDYRIMITECLNYKGLIHLIQELELKVYIKSMTGFFYYQCDGLNLKYILNGMAFRCNELLADEYDDLMTFNIKDVYIECPGFKDIERYREKIESNNIRVENEIKVLKAKEERYLNEYIDLTREINSMYMCRFDNKNYDDLLKLRKKCYITIQEIQEDIVEISNKKIVDRTKNKHTDGFLLVGLFKGYNKIINIKEIQ